MKRFTRLPLLVVVVGVLGGCASGAGAGAGSGAEASKLTPREGVELDGPECSLESPECPEDLMCATLELEEGRRTLCVDTQQVCEQLQCARGECVILESYPAQIRCRR
ncbi:hypothetical protein ACLESO_51955 [Pyxidicoccus sp. 3LG]